jgi:hypothetical protein
MPRGSVGFALQEIVEQGQTAPSGLAEVVSDVGALIDAAASGDQELAETVGAFEPRVVSTLKEFISVIHKAGATFRLVANDRTYRFDAERVVTVKRGAGQSHAFTLLGIEPPSERT